MSVKATAPSATAVELKPNPRLIFWDYDDTIPEVSIL
jgi:hypothetical protein